MKLDITIKESDVGVSSTSEIQIVLYIEYMPCYIAQVVLRQCEASDE